MTKYWADIELHQQGLQDDEWNKVFDRVMELVMPFGCGCDECTTELAKITEDIDLRWLLFGGVSGTGKDGALITRATYMYDASDMAEANMLAGFVLDEWLMPGLGDMVNGGWFKIEIEEDTDV